MLPNCVRANARAGLKALVTVLSTLLAHAAGAQVVRYVDADAPAGGDGMTWATAFNDLQNALAAANVDPSISQLWIAEGTYKPAGAGGSNSATFQLRNGLALYGGFDGTETSLAERDVVAHVTTLSGDLNGDDPPTFNGPPPPALHDNSFHLVTGSGVDASARLDGVTLRGGSAHGPTTPDRVGGALLCLAGSPTIAQCTFIHNFSADRGGAAYCAGGSPATFTLCTFDSNRTTIGFGTPSNDFGGGAIYLNDSDASVSNCVFQSNRFVAGAAGGAVLSLFSSPTIADCTFISNGDSPNNFSGVGGAIRNVESAPDITHCTFAGNRAAGGGSISNLDSPANICDCLFERGAVSSHAEGGGAIRISGDTTPTTIVNCVFDRLAAEIGGAISIGSAADPLIVNCRFVGNRAYLFDGGAISTGGDAAPTLVSCAFSGNDSTFSGSGGSAAIFHNSTGALLVVNSTFAGNTANPNLPGAAAITGSNITLRNCIVVHNTPAQLGASVTATYSCVQGGWAGTGNIDSSDPGFADEDGADNTIGSPDDDLRLIHSSPCIDAARNDDVPADLADLDGDRNTAEPTPLDLALGLRFYDHAATTDTGSGTPPIVDMGAHEFRLPCEGDTDNSGAVDVDDLIAVILGWGACPDCPPSHCATDIAPFPDGDCTTDVDDLIAVILAWGDCP